MISPTLPTIDELGPHLSRLNNEPGSVILVAVELPTSPNFCRVGIGFFNVEERKALRAALARCRNRRESQEKEQEERCG